DLGLTQRMTACDLEVAIDSVGSEHQEQTIVPVVARLRVDRDSRTALAAYDDRFAGPAAQSRCNPAAIRSGMKPNGVTRLHLVCGSQCRCQVPRLGRRTISFWRAARRHMELGGRDLNRDCDEEKPTQRSPDPSANGESRCVRHDEIYNPRFPIRHACGA